MAKSSSDEIKKVGRPKESLSQTVQARIICELMPKPKQFEELYEELRMNRTTLSNHLGKLVGKGIVAREVLRVKGHQVRYSLNPYSLLKHTDIADMIFRARSDRAIREYKEKGMETDFAKGYADVFISKAWIRSELQKEVLSKLEGKEKLWIDPQQEVVDEALRYYRCQMLDQLLKDKERGIGKPSESFEEYCGRLSAEIDLVAELTLLKDFRENRICPECFFNGKFVLATQDPETGMMSCQRCGYTTEIVPSAETVEYEDQEPKREVEPVKYGKRELGSHPEDEKRFLKRLRK